jgi:hypothetical protein
MKTVGNGRKTPQPFSTFKFEYENESVKPDMKMNANLQNIENFKNESITMPEKVICDALISDSETKRVTNKNISDAGE